jgi:GT2 family glycosyltransferase
MDRNFGGPAKPTNVGIKAAAGELIAVLDHDDVFADDKLALQASFLADVPEIVCVGGMAGEWKDGSGLPVSGSFAPVVLEGADVAPQGWVLRNDVTGRILRRGMFLVGFPSLMFRRSAWEQVGGIDESWKIVGDFDFLCRLVSTGGLGLQSSTVYYRRNHADNLSGRRVEMYLEEARVRDRLLSQPPLQDDRALYQAMAEHCLWVAYWFREDARYGPAWTMLRWARRFGAKWSAVAWQRCLLAAHIFLYKTGLRERVASGVTEAPWLLKKNLVRGKCCG